MVQRPAALAVVLALAAACGSGGPAGANRTSDAVPVHERTGSFVDRAHEAGIDFVHVNGMSGKRFMVEIMAPGVGLLDYDGDGDLDVYLVQGQPLDATYAAGRVDRPSGLNDRLYRNDLSVDGRGSPVPRFTDVTGAANVLAHGYGMGVATGDVDGDGWVDLYLTKYGAPNQLLRNRGDGTFEDVSAASRTNHHSWSVSASFLDVDRDGLLDLYVGNYLRYGLEGNAPCFDAAGAVDYCTPHSFASLPDRLFRNTGDGTFADVTAQAGLAREPAPALGVSTADFNGDGWLDIYVANDGRENHLWLNRRDGTFENGAVLAGVALPAHGRPEASMGVDAGDFDDDGDEDVFVTELADEGSNLFVNDGSGVFEDRSTASGVGVASLGFTGFGTGWIDADSDGRLDLLTVNGTIQMIERLRQEGDAHPLHQRRLLFRNTGGGAFQDVTERAGTAFRQSDVGRGAAFGDVDNDGDVDVLVGNNNGAARLLINESRPHHWIGLRLADSTGSRDRPGTRVRIVPRGGRPLWRRARADGSYASASDPRVLGGLGDYGGPVDVHVTWPDGAIETWMDVPLDRYTTLKQGASR